MIENFAVLSKQEQQYFVDALLKTVNSEGTFSSDVKFELYNGPDNISSDDITGCLIISLANVTVDVPRTATWQADSEDVAGEDPDNYLNDIDYSNSAEDDIKSVFKTTTAVIDQYKVSLQTPRRQIRLIIIFLYKRIYLWLRITQVP